MRTHWQTINFGDTYWLVNNHRQPEKMKISEENLPALKAKTVTLKIRIKRHIDENLKLWKTQESYNLLYAIHRKLQESQKRWTTLSRGIAASRKDHRQNDVTRSVSRRDSGFTGRARDYERVSYKG